MDKEIKKTKVLLEMRPALGEFAGIPQEVRLLMYGLRKINTFDIEGMLQSSNRFLAKGKRDQKLHGNSFSQARLFNRYSRVIISLSEKTSRTKIAFILKWLRHRLITILIHGKVYLGLGEVQLTHFDSQHFKDFTWRTLFAKTLPASDFELVASVNHKICSIPWQTFHGVGLGFLNFNNKPKYPILNTKEFDVFISQTPYPGRVSKNTALVVRYHDAIPVLMPHTISDKSFHQASHFNALMSNVMSGAWFACVSEFTRQQLIKIFPEAAERSITIHNMISSHYFFEESSHEHIPNIIRGYLQQGTKLTDDELGTGAECFATMGSQKLNYLLIVSTIEPRKNHLNLVAAWELLKTEVDPDLKLLVVGAPGWDYAPLLTAMQPWIEQGSIYILNSVPAYYLRLLYRHAAATVCPSICEGFDFSGVESMRCGGITVASDIPVHREVYGNAAEYFDPYAVSSLVNALRKVLYQPNSSQIQESLRQQGQIVSARYLPENILPKWESFIQCVKEGSLMGMNLPLRASAQRVAAESVQRQLKI
ncbi:glycosyltransferase family 4 protein [Legionella lytica]|uniref:Glycosyltransferase family 4 protein n=1 Tax=Legionella lytica TaxID=96232 RepID=A0ABY4Y9I9_9GAMM|nr:glycosyltransferase family 1 protein [Legionella lytica]USQ13754.1 glycosyltransferase family 4 protein [Legionella lytica]